MVLVMIRFAARPVPQICMAARRDTVILPCAHLLYCQACLAAASEVRAVERRSALPSRACMWCRTHSPPRTGCAALVALTRFLRTHPLPLRRRLQADIRRVGRDRCPCCRCPIQGRLTCNFLSSTAEGGLGGAAGEQQEGYGRWAS